MPKRNNPGCGCCSDNPPIISTLCCSPILVPAHLIITFSNITYQDIGLVNHTFPGYSTPLDYVVGGFAGDGWYGCGEMPMGWQNTGNTYFGFVHNTLDCLIGHVGYITRALFFYRCTLVSGSNKWVLTSYFLHCTAGASGDLPVDSSTYSCPANPASPSLPTGVTATTPCGSWVETSKTCSPYSTTIQGVGFSTNTGVIVPAA